MTTPEIVLIITTTAGGIVTVINAIRSSTRGQVHQLNEKADTAINQNEQLDKKALEIKTQTDGNYSELNKKIDILVSENALLREKNLTLEKAMLILATKEGERKIRSTDLERQ